MWLKTRAISPLSAAFAYIYFAITPSAAQITQREEAFSRLRAMDEQLQYRNAISKYKQDNLKSIDQQIQSLNQSIDDSARNTQYWLASKLAGGLKSESAIIGILKFINKRALAYSEIENPLKQVNQAFSASVKLAQLGSVREVNARGYVASEAITDVMYAERDIQIAGMKQAGFLPKTYAPRDYRGDRSYISLGGDVPTSFYGGNTWRLRETLTQVPGIAPLKDSSNAAVCDIAMAEGNELNELLRQFAQSYGTCKLSPVNVDPQNQSGRLTVICNFKAAPWPGATATSMAIEFRAQRLTQEMIVIEQTTQGGLTRSTYERCSP